MLSLDSAIPYFLVKIDPDDVLRVMPRLWVRWPLGILSKCMEGLGTVHPFTLLACSLTPVAYVDATRPNMVWDQDGIAHVVSSVHIYTDGSHVSAADVASWSVVVLVRNPSGNYLRLGHFCGQVILDPLDWRFIGASKNTSYSAELSGIA